MLRCGAMCCRSGGWAITSQLCERPWGRSLTVQYPAPRGVGVGDKHQPHPGHPERGNWTAPLEKTDPQPMATQNILWAVPNIRHRRPPNRATRLAMATTSATGCFCVQLVAAFVERSARGRGEVGGVWWGAWPWMPSGVCHDVRSPRFFLRI